VRHAARAAWALAATVGLIAMSAAIPVERPPQAQGTSAPPTVTGTPQGPTILVPEQVNVRLGPAVGYEQVGVLIAGQRAPAIGRSPGGDWIQIVYPGVPGNVAWVYAPLVILESSPGLLPIVEPPPTATPRVTATLDPTLAAQFNLGQIEATRLPTFTPAQPVVPLEFEPTTEEGRGGFPPILAILTFFVVGLFGLMISLLRGR